MLTEQEAKVEFDKIRVPFLLSMQEVTMLTAMLSTAIEQGLSDQGVKALHKKLHDVSTEAVFSSAAFLVKRKYGMK